jgi:membrane associated rhomboid family serine protease
VITFSISGISIGAHIGGLIAGIAVMLAYVRGRSSVPLSVAGALAVAAASVVFAYAVV